MRALIVGLVLASAGGGNGAGSAESLLRAAEQRLFRAIQTRDVAALDAELAADFVHVGPDGESDRAGFLRGIEAMPFRVLDLRGEDLRVRVLGDVAIVSGIQQARVALPDGTEVDATSAFTDLFALTDGAWRLRHAVSVDLSGPPPGQ